jgi:hypothetical protein
VGNLLGLKSAVPRFELRSHSPLVTHSGDIPWERAPGADLRFAAGNATHHEYEYEYAWHPPPALKGSALFQMNEFDSELVLTAIDLRIRNRQIKSSRPNAPGIDIKDPLTPTNSRPVRMPGYNH